MGLLLIALGLFLWSSAHFFKRRYPARRAELGERAKGPIAVIILAGIVFMVLGYRWADGTFYWGPTPAMTGINNLAVLFAFYLFAASGAKTRITQYIRHPQLTAVIVWALAHLLVNGDTPSFLLFGGLLVWAVAEIVIINRAEPDWTPAHAVPIRKEITAVVAAVVTFVVVALIHGWVGPSPFG